MRFSHFAVQGFFSSGFKKKALDIDLAWELPQPTWLGSPAPRVLTSDVLDWMPP